jgi:hypothetical protein
MDDNSLSLHLVDESIDAEDQFAAGYAGSA